MLSVCIYFILVLLVLLLLLLLLASKQASKRKSWVTGAFSHDLMRYSLSMSFWGGGGILAFAFASFVFFMLFSGETQTNIPYF